MSAFRLFIVDDEPAYTELLAYALDEHEGLTIDVFHTGADAVAALDRAPHLVLLDVVMPGQDGLVTLEQIKAHHPDLPVIMISSQASVQVALDAIRRGATDYLTKGQDDLLRVSGLVHRVRQEVLLRQEVDQLRARMQAPQTLTRLLGDSPAMGRTIQIILKVVRGDLSVVIFGESGTGKELVAQAIHDNSPRRTHPFVAINCAAIPRDLMESAFLGHVKGAFTGAHADRPGVFEQADGGTLFLDEIGELDLDLQAKLLRVLQDQQFQRVGGQRLIRTDVRLLAATNQDIHAMIRAGTFREDLFYRICQFPVTLPPLRERGDDVLLLAEHFLRAYLDENPTFGPKTLSAATRHRLLRHPWPGNVRELKTVIERAVLISESPVIQPADLMLQVTPRPRSAPHDLGGDAANLPATPPQVHIQTAHVPEDIVPLEDVKRLALEHAYYVCGGNVDQTATRLQITRSTVYRLLRKYEIKS